jgi:hypothetical protein
MDFCVVAADVSESSEVVYSPDPFVRDEYSEPEPDPLVLRQHPIAPTDLWDWYQHVLNQQPAETRPIDLLLGSTILQRCWGAMPYEYTLAVGDDGQPYEDFTINFSMAQ